MTGMGQSRRLGDVAFIWAFPSISDMMVRIANCSNGLKAESLRGRVSVQIAKPATELYYQREPGRRPSR
jgi:hypothetical protein